MLVPIIAIVVAIGAWTDRTQVALSKGPTAVPAAKPWDAIVEISRHGRRLDGFRPVLTITGLGEAEELRRQGGRLRALPGAGDLPAPGLLHSTRCRSRDRVAARGTVYAIPKPCDPQSSSFCYR